MSLVTKNDWYMWPDSDEEPADDIDARDRKIARMIDEVKNVTLPSWVPVYFGKVRPHLSL